MSEIVRKIVRDPHTGGVIFAAQQDVEPILEQNRKLLNAPRSSSRLHHNGLECWYRVASIPLILLEQWWKEGLRFTDPDFIANARGRLNSAEFEGLRTAPGRI